MATVEGRPKQAATRRKPRAADRLFNRELSRIDWSTRVLEQALDQSQPLLERVKYCAFFSSHLDEFFAVRVAGLLDQAASGLNVRSDGRPDAARDARRDPQARGGADRAADAALERATSALRSRARGSSSPGSTELTEEELVELAARFEQEVYPVLTPLAVGPGQPFPYISALSLSLAVFVRDPDTGEERLARVKVPEGLPRFMEVGRARGLRPARGRDRALPRLALPADGDQRARRSSGVTRDADFEVSDEADDLLEAVQLELRRRRFGDIVRVEVSASAARRDARAPEARPRRSHDEQIYLVDGLLDLADAMAARTRSTGPS